MTIQNRDNIIPLREVDTTAYLDTLRELVEEGKTVSILVSGNSMSPLLIHRRDRVFFEKPARTLKRGDIVFYRRANGQYVMHRIYKIKKDGFYMTGDAQSEIEGPLKREQIFALITKCERKGKMIVPGDLRWEFFEKVWIRMVPFRMMIWKTYEKAKSILKRR